MEAKISGGVREVHQLNFDLNSPLIVLISCLAALVGSLARNNL